MTERASLPTAEERKRLLKARYRREQRFRLMGAGAIIFALSFLVILFVAIIANGASAFRSATIEIPVTFEATALGLSPGASKAEIEAAPTTSFRTLARQSLYRTLGADTASAQDAADALLSLGVDQELKEELADRPSLLGRTVEVELLASGDVNTLVKGDMDRTLPEERRRINDVQLAMLDRLDAAGRLGTTFNTNLFTSGAATEPELAGMGVALVGSFMMMLVVLLLATPIGVAAAIYLEEFAQRNRFTHFLEININNLAAVPSIVFGILGLALFINFFGFPTASPLTGGFVLALMTLPTIIIATRASLRAVPPSIRQAALALGASRTQMVFHQVLPLSAPGILTGTIIGLARALGETAPLLMIGMVASIFIFPGSPLDPAPALPVQIYMWSGAAERGFVALTSAGSIVLLVFLLAMNAAAIYLRRRFERRW